MTVEEIRATAAQLEAALAGEAAEPQGSGAGEREGMGDGERRRRREGEAGKGRRKGDP